MILIIIKLTDNTKEIKIKEDDLVIKADIEEEDLVNV